MILCIEIVKVKEKNKIHYYSIFTPDVPNFNTFYMGLDSEQSKLYFFKKQKFDNKPDKIFDLKDLDKIVGEFPFDVPGKVAMIAVVKGVRAIQQKEFPEYLSHIAG